MFGGVAIEQGITKHLNFTGDLYFVNQANRGGEVAKNVNSVNIGFGFKFYPVARVSVMSGIDYGLILDKITYESGLKTFSDRWGYVFGLSYQVSSAFMIEPRFVTSLNPQLFDSTIQIAVAYRLNREK